MNKTAAPVAGLLSALFVASLGFGPETARAEGNDGFNWHLRSQALSDKAETGSTEVTGSIAPASKAPPIPVAAPAKSPATAEKTTSGSDRLAGEAAAHAGKALGYDGSDRGRYRDLIAKHASANGIPFALADAVVRIESRYNPNVRHGGAVGLMQIKPATARGLGYQGGAGGLMHPETNIRWGMLYLAQAYRMSRGDTCATVMRYQSGHGATRLSGANRVYCAKARTIMASLR